MNRAPVRSKLKLEDWYASAERQEAVEGLAAASKGLEDAAKDLAERRSQSEMPFSGPQFRAVAEHLPEGHWARGFVDSVAVNIDRNNALRGAQKEQVLAEVLQVLGQLSRDGEDGQFQDAEG